MPYVEGRTVHDADSHIFEPPGYAEQYTDPQHREALADGFPPTILGHTEIGWLPTVELTVHVFGAPPVDEPWLRAELRTRSIVGGLLDEDGELWAADGRLVARFRQLAMLIPRES